MVFMTANEALYVIIREMFACWLSDDVAGNYFQNIWHILAYQVSSLIIK